MSFHCILSERSEGERSSCCLGRQTQESTGKCGTADISVEGAKFVCQFHCSHVIIYSNRGGDDDHTVIVVLITIIYYHSPIATYKLFFSRRSVEG